MADIEFTPESGDVGFRPASEPSSGMGGQGFAGSTGQDLGQRAQDAAGRVSERASQAVDSSRDSVAGGMDTMGDRLDNVADNLTQRGGMASRAGSMVRGASDALDSGAEYVRNASFSDIRSDLTESIRSHPLLSMGVAIGAGYLLSKILD